MARGTSKRLQKSEPSATGGGQQAKLPYYPVFVQANGRIACCPTLLKAARDSHPECVDWHLKQGDCLPKLLRHQNARVQRPLHEAAGAKPPPDGRSSSRPQCTLCVEAMLAAGLKGSWLDEDGRSSLERAAMIGCVPCIEILLRSPTRSVDMDAVRAQQNAALVEAARINSETSVRALLGAAPASTSEASVEGQGSESRLGPALIAAARSGSYDCITPLVEAGAVLNPVVDASDDCCPSSPLIEAVKGEVANTTQKSDRAPDIIRLLVKLGAEVNDQGSYGHQSALHVSASKGRCDCMQALLELGANPMALDGSGRSLLHIVAGSAHPEACQLLVNHITESSGTATAAAAMLARKDREGWSPWQAVGWAACWRSTPEVTLCVSMFISLLEASGGSQAVAGALREKLEYDGKTILHSAAGCRHDHYLRALMKTPEGFRAALEVEDDEGATPIALARQIGHDFNDVHRAFAQAPFVPCCSGLAEAAEKGHVACVKHALNDACPAARADIGMAGEDPHPLAAISHGCEASCSKITRLLLEAGFHPDGRHGDYFPLRIAADAEFFNGCSEGVCVECSRLLIDAGAGGLLASFKNGVRDSAMWSILYYASVTDGDESFTQLAKVALLACDIRDDVHGVTDVFRWAGGRNMELPKLLAEAGADVMAKSDTGRTALHMAAGLLDVELEDEEEDIFRDSDEHVELVTWLISEGAFVDATDNAGNTALHVAAELGLRKVAAVLLDHGADALLQNFNGGNSLHMAARSGSSTLMARLIDRGVDVNAKASDGRTALHEASRTGDSSSVRMLLDEGADINETDDTLGWTPLRYAVANDNTEALECLVDVGNDDLRQVLENVGNLLHTAAYHGSTAVMQILVNRGLDVASIIASNGETVMHNAAQNGGGLSVKWLLENGASLDVQDHQGRTPQTFAVHRGTRDENVLSVLQVIAGSDDGTNSMSVVWQGCNLLHLAASRGFERCVRYLVSKGQRVDSRTTDGEGQTAMHRAASNVNKNGAGVVRALAKFGANVDARDYLGRTPLYLAASLDGQLDIVTTLLELRASIHIADNGKRTPLWAAAKNGNLACSSLLVARGADMTLRDSQGRNALGASLAGSHDTMSDREDVMKLLIDLGCPVGGTEIDAASRGGLTDSFAKAVTARMSGGTSARELFKETSLAYSYDGACVAADDVGEALPADTEPAASMTTVRVSSEPPRIYKSRRRCRDASAGEVVASSKTYHVDSLRLRQAVAHLEGPGEVGKCLLLKLLLPPPIGWASFYRSRSIVRSSDSSTGESETQTEHPGSTAGDVEVPTYRRPPAPLVAEVELSCNGDDFDRDGFEAVLEYLYTGQVVGATCGNIHGGGSLAKTQEVGAHAVASHRAAAFFGLPRLQRMIRAWLKENGAEMEDDGTGVLSELADGSSEDVSKKRKLSSRKELPFLG
eukprot:g4895.t1